MRDEAEETEICLYILICLLYKESPPPTPKKGGGFGTIDSDVGGWGGVGVTFFMAYLTSFAENFP